MKFYWNIAIPICLDIVSGYYYATMAELNSCNKDLIACKVWNIYIFISADLGIHIYLLKHISVPTGHSAQ